MQARAYPTVQEHDRAHVDAQRPLRSTREQLLRDTHGVIMGNDDRARDLRVAEHGERDRELLVVRVAVRERLRRRSEAEEVEGDAAMVGLEAVHYVREVEAARRKAVQEDDRWPLAYLSHEDTVRPEREEPASRLPGRVVHGSAHETTLPGVVRAYASSMALTPPSMAG